MKKIGLTGSIASGKSTVSDYLKSKRIAVIDADLIARDVIKPQTRGFDQIVSEFGVEVLSRNEMNEISDECINEYDNEYAHAQINRDVLSQIVFNDAKKRRKLEEILHPLIMEEMLRQASEYEENGADVVVFDIPLLIEGNLMYLVDEIWLVVADLDTQISRLKSRNGYDVEFAQKIIATQMPTSQKIKHADVIIENNTSLEDLYSKIQTLI